jgi:hypothetical protein
MYHRLDHGPVETERFRVEFLQALCKHPKSSMQAVSSDAHRSFKNVAAKIINVSVNGVG